MDIPQMVLLTEWYKLRKVIDEGKLKMAPYILREMDVRKLIIASVFANQIEGTHYTPLESGYSLKGVLKLDRQIDEAALPAVIEILQKEKVNTDALIKHEPSLVVKFYKEMQKDYRDIMDQALITKPAAPTLEIVPPKAKK
jgi:hypothetical protein